MTGRARPLAALGTAVLIMAAAGAHADVQHYESFGLQVYRNGQVVVHVWEGVVTGMLPVPYLSPTDTLEVRFFDPDSVLFVPPVSNAWLKHLLSAPATAHYDSLGQWKFSLTGTQAGASANIYLRLWFDNHFDYTSPPIPYVVNSSTGVAEEGSLPGVTLATFPNPITSSGGIRYSLPGESHVELSLFDASGRRVRGLTAGTRKPGAHEEPLSVDGLPGGVYFVRLTTNLGSLSRRLLIVR